MLRDKTIALVTRRALQPYNSQTMAHLRHRGGARPCGGKDLVTQFTSDRLLLFGATGDLSRRMLLPSLCSLDADGLLDPAVEIIGTARSDLDNLSFRNFAREALEQFLPPNRRGGIATFLNRLIFQKLDANDIDGFATLAEKVGTPQKGLSIFLSTAPSLFEATIHGLVKSGLSGPNVRIGLEKPLGVDLASSKVINDAVAAAFPEDRIFRIDHYLSLIHI